MEPEVLEDYEFLKDFYNKHKNDIAEIEAMKAVLAFNWTAIAFGTFLFLVCALL